MNHPNAVLLKQLYSHWVEGNFQAMLDVCPENITFQVPGKSALAGKYTKANFVEGFALKQKTLSGGTFKLEVHDILASDLHTAVLASAKVTTHGKAAELRTVHIWRFENGKPIAWYEYPRDLYAFDATWTG